MLDISKLNDNELRLAAALSQATNKIDKYMVLLYFVYGFSLTKKELAEVIKKAEVTIERRIKEGVNIPEYIKSSDRNKSSYIFPIYEVSLFISNTIKIA